jgi:oxygen-independent coproporphyrinogen-3 oxidase
LEANPIDITDELAEFLFQHHVHRISLGVQTGHESFLQLLGRTEGPDQVKNALNILRAHGIENINLDFIYAIPQETLTDLKADIEYALSLKPKHLSFYSLILEERTKLFYEVQRGRIKPLLIDQEADQFEFVMDELPKHGFRQYEISNFALPGFESLHNQIYWETEPYLGLGMGAHSQIGLKRFHNHATLQKYLDAVRQTGTGIERVDPCDLEQEFGILGLRKTAGISLKTFHDRFGNELLTRFPRLRKNLAEGLLKREEDVLRLTRHGILVMNYVEESFME